MGLGSKDINSAIEDQVFIEFEDRDQCKGTGSSKIFLICVFWLIHVL